MTPPDPAPPEPQALAREIVAAVREPFLVLDRTARVLLASPAFHLAFDLPVDDVVGREIYALGRGEWDVPALRALFETRAPAAETVEGYEVEQEQPGGGRRRVALDVRPLRRGSNRIHLFLVSLRLLPAASAGTGRDLPEEQLRRLLVESSPDLVTIHRATGECLYAGEEAALGYTKAETLALRPCDLVHAHDRDRLDALVEGVRDGDFRRATLRMRRKSGEYAWLDVTVRAVASPNGELLLHASSRDVTQRQRAEDALRWLSRQTRLILDSAGEGIFGLDPRGNLTFVNPAAARLLGYEVPDLLGQPYATFVQAEEGAAADRRLDPIAATLQGRAVPALSEDRFLRRDGSRVPVEYTCTPARDGEAVMGAVVTFRDVSERRRAEETLRRAERLAGAAQTVVALRHEINNPLTTLLAEASLLELGGNSPEEEREMIASIAEQARRIRDVLRRLGEARDGG